MKIENYLNKNNIYITSIMRLIKIDTNSNTVQGLFEILINLNNELEQIDKNIRYLTFNRNDDDYEIEKYKFINKTKLFNITYEKYLELLTEIEKKRIDKI